VKEGAFVDVYKDGSMVTRWALLKGEDSSPADCLVDCRAAKEKIDSSATEGGGRSGRKVESGMKIQEGAGGLE
jgi:hypothetical protein